MPDSTLAKLSQRLLGAAGLCLIFLALPGILTALGLPKREAVYLSVPASSGPFGFAHHEIFEKSEPIDLLFVGPSTLWTAIHTPAIEAHFQARFGRKPTVVVLGSNWRGEDLTYFELRDIIVRRRVRVVVVQPPTVGFGQQAPHSQAYHWFTGLDGSDVAGLPIRYRRALFAETVWGAPRHVLSSFRPNSPALAPFNQDWAIEPSGAYLVRRAMEGHKYLDWNAQVPTLTTTDLFPTPQDLLSSPPLDSYAAHFVEQVRDVAMSQGSRLVGLEVPSFASHRSNHRVTHPDWWHRMGTRTPLIAPLPLKIFLGISDPESANLFYDPSHLNRNGAELFTRAILPALERVYVTSAP